MSPGNSGTHDQVWFRVMARLTEEEGTEVRGELQWFVVEGAQGMRVIP